MLLIIDVGNSFVKCAVFEENTILEKIIFEEIEALKNFKKILKKYSKIEKIVVSAVGKLNNEVLEYLKSTNLLEIISRETIMPFNNLYKTPQTVGVDRLVLVSGAVLIFPNKNILIIDAGTCITYDFVDEFRNYYGGSISPGLRMRFKSLNDYTLSLPLLKPELVSGFIGNTTESAIRTGIQNGLIYEIEGFINEYFSEFKDLTIILTGGDAEFLAKSLKNTIFANSNFLLESLNNLYTYSKNKNG